MINLDGSSDRLAQATTQLHAAEITFERISVFEGRGLDSFTVPDCDTAAFKTFMGREAEGGEYSRYKSHLAAAHRIVDSGDEIALAFEDDIIIDTDSLAVIEESPQALKPAVC